MKLGCSQAMRVSGGRIIAITESGDIAWESGMRRTVEGSYSSRVLVKPFDDRTLWISGNPSKFLQGHNLFGSNHLRLVIYRFLDKLFPALGLEPTRHDKLLWRTGFYQVLMVDIAESFRLPCQNDVSRWMRAAARRMHGRHQGVSAYQDETLYIGKKSRRIATKIYDKAQELKRHRLPEQIPCRDQLHEYARGLLRVEVRLHSMELKKRGLARGCDWRKAEPERVMRERLGVIEMADKICLTSKEVTELPDKLVPVYRLWQNGEDLRAMFSRSTFYRHRKELKKVGIDIAVPPSSPQESQVIPLIKVLAAEQIIAPPAWAVGTPLLACA